MRYFRISCIILRLGNKAIRMLEKHWNKATTIIILGNTICNIDYMYMYMYVHLRCSHTDGTTVEVPSHRSQPELASSKDGSVAR